MKTGKSLNVNAYRRALLAKRNELVECIYAHRTETPTVRRERDRTETSLQEVVKDLAYVSMENEIRMLAEIELSLRRLETGEYGLCGSCGALISAATLRAKLWTRVCRVCAERSLGRMPAPPQGRRTRDTVEVAKNVIRLQQTPSESKNDGA